jgi:signal transduction histidine kinase
LFSSRPRFDALAVSWLVTILLVLTVLYLASKSSEPLPEHITVQYCTPADKAWTLIEAKRCEYVTQQFLIRSTQQDSIIWAKINLQEIERSSSPVTIHVAPHLVKAVEVLDGDTGKILAGPVGMDYPYSDKHGRIGGYAFTLAAPAGRDKIYYVRIATSGLPYAFVTATASDRTGQARLNQQLGLGIHLGALGLLLLASGSVFVATRDRITGCFALVILNLLLATLAGSGYLFEHFWPNWPRFNAFFFTAMLYLRVGLWVLLAQTFLASYHPPQWYWKLCLFTYALVAFMIALPLLELGYVSNWLLLIFGVTLIPISQILGIKATPDIRSIYKRLLILGFTAGALLVWATLLVTLLPTQDPTISIQFARFVDYVNPLILLTLVVLHYRETSLQLEQTRKENLTMRLGLEFEKKVREERKLLIDMLTHEIKNPLASISMAVGSLSNMLQNKDIHLMRRIENISQSVRNMDMVLERCNLMNQLDQNTLQLEPEPIEVPVLVEQILKRFPNAARVSVHCDASLEFFTDAQFLQMIVSNLIENALKYSSSKSTVSLSFDLTTKAQSLRINITSLIGPKGSPDKAMLFQRYYRNPLAQDTSGSGIGLYLAQQLVKSLNGKIEYVPTETEVVFRVEIPEVKYHE